MSKNISASCSEEDTAANRKDGEHGDLSKADFLGWIVAKCKLLRENPKTFFEFKALETFSELIAAVLVKAYKNDAVKCIENLYRSIIDEMWTKLEEQNGNNRRGIQDIAFTWPFVKGFVDEIALWKERQQQAKKDFFIRRAFQEAKNVCPPVVVTVSPGLDDDDDEPNTSITLRKRQSAEQRLQSPNSSVVFLGSLSGCTPTNWRTTRKEENRDENELVKKRRIDGGAEEQRKSKAEKPIKQEVIEVEDDEQQRNEDITKRTNSNTKKGVVAMNGNQHSQSASSHATQADNGRGENAAKEDGQQQQQQQQQKGREDEEKEEDEELYSRSFGSKSMFEIEEEPTTTKEQHLSKEVKQEPEEKNGEENGGQSEPSEAGEMAGGKENDQQEEDEEQTDEDEEEEESDSSESDGTDTPPPVPNPNIVRPYSPFKIGLNTANGGLAQCKREILDEFDVGPQLNQFDVDGIGQCCSSACLPKERFSGENRSEFDLFDHDHPVPPSFPTPAPPAKTAQSKYSGKVRIRKRLEYEAEQKVKRRLFLGAKVLRFSEKNLTRTFLIDEGNVMSRSTANDKSPFFIASTTTKFLKKSVKPKNEAQKRRRHLDAQSMADVRELVTTVEDRVKEVLNQQNCSTDELAIARGDRLVRFSRLLLTDSLLQRLDEEVLKNTFVLRALEHPRDIGLFIEKGLNSNSQFLRNPSHLAYFEFSYLFVCYGYDQIVHCGRVPDPSEFLSMLRDWFISTLPAHDQFILMKAYEEENHYYYVHPRIVAVTIPEVGECADHFRVFNDHLRMTVSADSGHSSRTGHNDRFLLLDWARLVAKCSDDSALDSEEKRMQMLVKEMKEEFGVLIK